jgi:hypothetical protein
VASLLRPRRAAEIRRADALADSGDFAAAIETLSEANRRRRDSGVERRLIELRHRAGESAVAAQDATGTPVEPASTALSLVDGIPEVGPEGLNAATLRAAVLEKGCLLVRGLVPREDAESLGRDIDHAFAAREAGQNGDSDGYYDEFSPPDHPGFVERAFTAETGGMWTVDSPRTMFSVIDLFERAGVREVLSDYLGGRPTVSAQKGTLRKVSRARVGWHQDGRFLGQVRTMNIWLALSRCGDVAPGLDLIPRRLDEIVPAGTEGAEFEWSVAQSVAERVAGDAGIVRPIFEPGDAVLFDDLFLHSTAAEDDMTEPRYAIETWFFSPAGFPGEYVPLIF